MSIDLIFQVKDVQETDSLQELARKMVDSLVKDPVSLAILQDRYEYTFKENRLSKEEFDRLRNEGSDPDDRRSESYQYYITGNIGKHFLEGNLFEPIDTIFVILARHINREYLDRYYDPNHIGAKRTSWLIKHVLELPLEELGVLVQEELMRR